jgi:hypothetical protein
MSRRRTALTFVLATGLVVTSASPIVGWAAGFKNNYRIPLAYHWNGRTWTEMAASAVHPSGGSATVWTSGSAWGRVTDHWADRTLAIRGAGS